MKDKNGLGYDIIRILIVVGIILIALYLFKFDLSSFKFQDFSSTFLNIFVSLLGFILTAITILIMFDSDKNVDLKKLKEAGYYKQILERFISTTFVSFLGMVLFIFLTLLNSYNINLILNYIINSLILFIFLLVILRIYRVLNVLHLIYKIVYKK